MSHRAEVSGVGSRGTALPPSGEQYPITAGDQRAVVVEVGGGVREYVVGRRPVLDGYPVDAICSGARGAPLVPWPNRLEDGRYGFDGEEHQLPLTEPERHNAIHGLLRWRNWQLHDRRGNEVAVGTVLHPTEGYPFTLDVQVRYLLDAAGLTVTTTATNRGDRPCPYGSGQHPYLAAGRGGIDECVLELRAGTRIATDDRGLPAGRRRVDGSRFDFRRPRRIGATRIDQAFTDLERDGDGLARVRLRAPDGAETVLRVDGGHPYLALFTADTLPGDEWRRGLGVAPMTCAPNAFRSGEGLLVLAPGETVTTTWGVSPSWLS